MLRSVTQLPRNADGAVAPIVAVSLFALIGIGGLAFDYARMASLDTELQDAADQAALAAASQLDGKAGACDRAVAAARTMITNRTLISNDGGTLDVQIADPGVCNEDGSITDNVAASIRFFQDKAKTTPADGNANAHFVEVRVDPREVNLALTPVVGFFSAEFEGKAFAGLGQAVCRVPPVMMCNPTEDDDLSTYDPFDPTDYVGRGLRLIANNGGPTMGPGNFGFLENNAEGAGANLLKQLLGYDSPPGDCTQVDGVTTNPGAMESVISALNSRFDVYATGQLNAIDCGPGGECSSSANSVKDLVMDRNGPNLACGDASGGSKGWKEASSPYRPTTATALATTVTPQSMGHPRDMCHAVSYNGNCTFNGVSPHTIGDGNWDIDAYFRVNHPTLAASGLYPTGLTSAIMATSPLPEGVTRTYPTRYQVYKWEMGATSAQANLPVDRTIGSGSSARYSYGRAICNPSGQRPDDVKLDRRVLTVAVVNCKSHDNGDGISGKEENVAVIDWIDVFLVEPSFPRNGGGLTKYGDVYVEVIGSSSTGGSSEEVQLVKKSVPFLIE